jgi:hypothetical protein
MAHGFPQLFAGLSRKSKLTKKFGKTGRSRARPRVMGGFLSGRPATKVTVESGLKLDLGRLLRLRLLVPGGHRAGSIVWTYSATGEECGTVGYTADLTDLAHAFVQLRYSANGTPMHYPIWLHRTPCRFGGFRWWWVCPRTGHLATKLYLPPGATTFASRRAYRMAYRSERGGPMDRSHLRQRRIFEKPGGDYRIFEPAPPMRPKGMHRRTYERLLAELRAAEQRHDTIFTIGVARLLKKDPSFRDRLPGL